MAKRILIVDDSPDVRESLCTFLKSRGYDICEGANGVEAIETAKKLRPDLVIIDARMPSLNGIEAASVIRRELRPNVRIIMLTQYDQLLGKSLSSAAGVNMVLSKSAGLDKLLQVVEELLQSGRRAGQG